MVLIGAVWVGENTCSEQTYHSSLFKSICEEEA